MYQNVIPSLFSKLLFGREMFLKKLTASLKSVAIFELLERILD
jgi:hypothetical protein